MTTCSVDDLKGNTLLQVEGKLGVYFFCKYFCVVHFVCPVIIPLGVFL